MDKKDIIANPEKYLSAMGDDLDLRLNKIRLSDSERESIVTKQSAKSLRNTVFGMFPLGQAINTILDWNENIASEIEQVKKQKLLGEYFEKADSNETALTEIKAFLTTPHGSTLFNKILQIAEDSPPDPKLLGFLGSALKHISDSDFIALFEDHKFALSQIEKLTPQGLAVLSDYSNWPVFHLGGFSASGDMVTSNWTQEFSETYSKSKGIVEPPILQRLRHAIEDLRTQKLVVAKLQPNPKNYAACKLSSIGATIQDYLTA